MKNPLGSKRTIFTQLGEGRYKFCDISHWIGGVCDISHRIWENVPDAIYVEVSLNQVDVF